MLVSVHIPKTGGVTFRRSVLEPAFGDRLLLDYADRPLAHETSERNASAQAFVPDDALLRRYDCVHGHFLAAKYANAPGRCEFAVWLRHPVQRVVSRFFFAQREGRGRIAAMTLRAFCREDHFHNLYAKYLWNFPIDRFDFVGITEDYASSVAVFRRRFGIASVADTPSNVNPHKEVAQDYDVAPAMRELIERANARDMEIYEHGKRHLARLKNQLRPSVGGDSLADGECSE